MIDVEGTIERLKRLLENFQGVSVVSTDARPGYLALIMRIERLESLGPIVYAVEGANVRFNIWTTAPGKPIRERGKPKYLMFRVVAKDRDDQAGTALDEMTFFGVYLVWYLHGVGVLETSEANRLLVDWDGALVTD